MDIVDFKDEIGFMSVERKFVLSGYTDHSLMSVLGVRKVSNCLP
jgi:hypothetical protein